MKSKKATKRALLSSALSLVLCFSMLLGTTFAWFTDVAKTGVNTIQSGKLDIQLLDKDGKTLEGKPLEFVKADDAPDDEKVLWEPGATYHTQGFQIYNNGNLYLKFKIFINGVTNGDAKLLEAIDFYLTSDPQNLTETVKLSNYGDEYTLAPGKYWDGSTEPNAEGSEDEQVIYLVGHMKEEADNQYQDLTIDGVGITVYATQVEAEVDSFDNKYDANATYKPWAGDVASLEELMSVTDTEKNTITISTAAQLAALAAYVNGDASMTPIATLADEEAVVYPPQNLKGYTVKLADNINLNNMPWTPIGAGEAKFEGKFDGQDHTIYNLRVDAASKAGLFGNVACSGRDAIVNLNVDGAIINSSHHAGVIAGSIYGNIDKCSVSDAVITLTTELTSNGYDNGDKAGGIVGYAANAKITNNTVTNVEIVGYRDIGGIVGCVAWDNYACEVTGNTVSCITLTLDGTNGYSSASANADAIVGSRRGETDTKKHVIENNSVDNVTTVTAISTADDLVAAFANLQAGDVLYIADDIDMTEKTITPVTGNKGFTMLGNGYTISNLNTDAAALFVAHSGSSVYVFDGVVLENCSVNSATNYGALFVGDGDTSDEITITDCHVKNCTVESAKYAAAFVGYTAGYNVQNNGPVYSDVTIEDCSVTGGSITGGGSVGAAVAHAGGNDDTTTTITNFTVNGVAINGEDAAHTGVVVGTANVGDTFINNAKYENVTGNYNGLYGRFVPGTTGKLTIDGNEVVLPQAWETLDIVTSDITRENQVADEYVEICHKSGNLTLKNVTFKNGLTIYTNETENSGSITLEGCTIYLSDGVPANALYNQCKADYGLNLNLVNGSDITFEFVNCTFTKSADHVYGTGNSYNVYIGGGYSANSISFTGCTFEGSGKHCIGCSSEGTSQYYALIVTGCNFKDWNNNADNGAAIRGNLPASDFAANITISGNTFGNSNGSTQSTVAIDSWTGSWS